MACASINMTETYHSQCLPQGPIVSKTLLGGQRSQVTTQERITSSLTTQNSTGFLLPDPEGPRDFPVEREPGKAEQSSQPKGILNVGRTLAMGGCGQFFPVVNAIPMQVELSLHHCHLWRLQGHHYKLTFLFIMGNLFIKYFKSSTDL